MRIELTPSERREVSDLSEAEIKAYRRFRRSGMGRDDAIQSAIDDGHEKALRAIGY